MGADAHETARELIHDDEYPVAAEHDRLAAKEIHAPEAVGRMADERQPRGSSAAGRRAIMFGQDAVHDVLVDVDPERLRDDACDPWTAESRIARLEFDDGPDDAFVRPFRSGLLRAGLEENSSQYLRRTNAR